MATSDGSAWKLGLLARGNGVGEGWWVPAGRGPSAPGCLPRYFPQDESNGEVSVKKKGNGMKITKEENGYAEVRRREAGARGGDKRGGWTFSDGNKR